MAGEWEDAPTSSASKEWEDAPLPSQKPVSKKTEPVSEPKPSSMFGDFVSIGKDVASSVKDLLPDIDYSKIAGAGTTGAVFGAATPEVSYGLGKILQLGPGPVKLAGKALERAAPLMSTFGQRAAGSAVGGLTAATGETTREAATSLGVDPKYANLIGIGVETLSPAFVNVTGQAIKRLPGVQGIKNVFDYVAKELGRDTASLTDAERRFIALEADKMRGKGGGTGELYRELEAGAQQIETKSAADALARQQKAEKEALDKLIESGKQPGLADRIITKSQIKVHNIGNADNDLSTIGQSQRKAIASRFKTENLERDATYKAKKAERDKIVKTKEQSGDVLENMPEYKNAIDELKNKLLIGAEAMEQKVAPVTEAGVKSSYQRIYDAMTGKKVSVTPEEAEALAQKGVQIVDGIDNVTQKPAKYVYFPTSFDALDHVRRKLGDVAYGIEQEGYDALGQDIAKNWYKKLSELQSKYAGPIQDELQAGYEMASGLLERFKGGPGAAVLKTEKLAPDMFSMDPKDVPVRFFGSKGGVADLVALTKNPALVEQTAGDYVAMNLKGKTAEQAANWVAKQEFLKAPELANLRPKINAYLKDLEAATTRAEGVRTTGKAQETEASRIQAVGEAEAKGISEEGRKRAEMILGDRFPEKRISEILSDPSKKLWQEVSTIVLRTPGGKELIDRAVAEHLADLAQAAERGSSAVNALEKLREPLTTTGLMTSERINDLMKQLQIMKAPEKQKLGWLANQFIRRGTTVGAQQLGSILGGMAPSIFGGQ